MDMILDKCIFQNSLFCFQLDMLLVHIGIASYRQFQCAPTTYVLSMNECFTINAFSQTSQLLFMFHCNEQNEQVFMLFGIHLADKNRLQLLRY